MNPRVDVDRSTVWVTQGSPNGFCPTHCMVHAQCTSWCVPARQAFARIARDMEAFWPVWLHEQYGDRSWRGAA